MLNTITNIDKASPARGKVHVGDELLAINGHEVEDVLDYRYWSYEPRLTLRLRSARTGEEYEVKPARARARTWASILRNTSWTSPGAAPTTAFSAS